MVKSRSSIVLLALTALLLAPASAASEDPAGAVQRVEAWRGSVRHFGRGVGAPSGRVRTCSEDGTNLFHLVSLEGGGFVAVAADAARPGVMAFSPAGELPAGDAGGPLWTMLAADGGALSSRAGREARRRPERHRRRRFAFSETTVAPPRAKARVARAGSGIASPGDVRVAPLVESAWGQKGAGNKYTYNYYVTNHWYCGCVATAMAQLMRYHRFPSDPVVPLSFTCKIGSEGETVELSMIGGEYDWNAMPLAPSSSITDAEREMIGRICYDAGVSARMHYQSSGSGAFLAFVFEPLKSVFGFASANSYMPENSLSATEIENAVLANLDAGFPVLLGIDDGYEGHGHAIVADGYGYEDGVLWCHLNMGWEGTDDLWYALPDIAAGGYSFNAVNSVIYNAFPALSGEIVSGRVTDESGNPLEGALVNIEYSQGMLTIETNVTTSAAGIYSLILPSLKGRRRNFTMTAQYGAGASPSVSASTSASRSPTSVDWEKGSYSLPGAGLSIGNSWGNDLAVAPAAGASAEVIAFTPASKGGDEGFELSFAGTGGARYRVEFAPSLVDAAWSPVERVLLAPAGLATIFLPSGEGSAGFWRVVPAEQ